MDIVARQLGLQPYQPCFEAMKSFTEDRDQNTPDEIWFLQHQSVFTQGRVGKPEYVLNPGDIPVVQIDRGGQVTYHGPGQITAYLLIDIKRMGIGVREMVTVIENSVVETLREWKIESAPRADAPGVYVEGKKVAALGLRVRRGCTYHGLNLNVDMDMEPWQRINPCGLDVPVTQLRDLVDPCPKIDQVEHTLALRLMSNLGYNAILPKDEFPPGIG